MTMKISDNTDKSDLYFSEDKFASTRNLGLLDARLDQDTLNVEDDELNSLWDIERVRMNADDKSQNKFNG